MFTLKTFEKLLEHNSVQEVDTLRESTEHYLKPLPRPSVKRVRMVEEPISAWQGPGDLLSIEMVRIPRGKPGESEANAAKWHVVGLHCGKGHQRNRNIFYGVWDQRGRI